MAGQLWKVSDGGDTHVSVRSFHMMIYSALQWDNITWQG